MYQVIARKYRPQCFEDVVNQEHVKQTLINAITQRRVGHGYIFSGPRGTGKTTMARILAKALNCEKGPTATPCQQCSSCREIAGGNSMDLVEIDAASNRRIDDIRELRENVRYRPVRDRYKVFIIDEAHQITPDAFNALLKTLEEPPEWVVFILCTTEPQEFPATIVSRCQSFPFRTVEMEHVVGRLQWICEQEGIEAEADALVTIALSGDGSIRDSLSTLDQAIASFGKKLEAGPVRDLLGSIPAEIAGQILQALRDQNSGAMLEIVDRLAREGRHLQHFCGELSRHFRNLLVMKVAGADTRLIAAGPEERKRLTEWLEQFSQEDLTRYLNLLIDLYRDLQHAPQPRFQLEIGLLKLVYAGRLQAIEKVLAGWNSGGSPAGESAPSQPKRPGGASTAAAETRAGNGAAQGLEAGPDLPPPAATARLAAAAGVGGAASPRIAVVAAPRNEPAENRAAVASGQRAPDSQPTTVGTASGPAGDRDAAHDATDAASGLQSRLAAVLRTQGDAPLADAVEHGRVEITGGRVEIRSLGDYRALLEMSVPMLQQAVRGVLAGNPHVTLGSDLGAGEAAVPSKGTPEANSAPSAAGSANLPPGPPETVQRALADPDIQYIQQRFAGGRIREVRNLRGYTA